MAVSFAQLLISLLIGISVIVVLTAKYRIHAFFALLIACFIVGLGAEMSFGSIMTSVKTGFGHIMQSLGLIIVMGTTLGVLLEHAGCTRVMANFLLRKVGERKAPLAMSLTGFIVGLPVFCDSGFIVLSGLNQSLARRTGISVVVMAISLATGLYAVHCLVPPHPGVTTAVGNLSADLGWVIAIGTLVAIPGMIAGYLWAGYAGKKLPAVEAKEEEILPLKHAPSVLMSFLPVIVPILLIAGNSIISIDNNSPGLLRRIFSIAGDPVIALAVGVVITLISLRNSTTRQFSKLLQEGAEKAGSILVIIGAGGAFGAVLASTNIGSHFSEALDLAALGLFFPFLLTFIIKTAQGSSTVAIITAASVVQPLLGSLGLDSEMGRLLAILAMGAGSMMISHANDAYFWVISKFSGLEMKPMLRVYSVATIWMGLVTLLVVFILSKFLL